MRRLCLFILILFLVIRSSSHRSVQYSSMIPTVTTLNSLSDTIRGIDVSTHQKKIYWSKVSNVDFVFIKATEGATLKDDRFAQNWDSVIKNGITHGAYHFYRPNVSPESQFENFKSVVKLEPGDLPPVLDAEVGSRNHTKLKNDFKKWLKMAEEHYGVTPIIYCNYGFWKLYFNDPYFSKYPLWIANYVTSDIDTVVKDWHFWQHTCYGKINGISGHVDQNLFNATQYNLDDICKK